MSTVKKPGKPKKKTVSQLKDKADTVFSTYIRRKYADPHTGLESCVTCGTVKLWKEMQAGHYETRGTNHLRYDERNVHPQCVGCNIFKKGNYPRYSIFMINTYGVGILTSLEEESKPIKQWKAFELEEIVERYKLMLDKLDRQE